MNKTDLLLRLQDIEWDDFGVSKPRNPLIAQMFLWKSLIERFGAAKGGYWKVVK